MSYKIIEPTVISFSGGRSSAYMLHRVLEENNGLPDQASVVFANTGKEMPQTLDFVQACSDSWGVPITWVELASVDTSGVYEKGRHKGKAINKHVTKIVDHKTASRNGEPFMALLRAKKMPPNVVARFCTAELKVRRMDDAAKADSHFIGIRSDEQRRAVKIHNKLEGGRLTWCPMSLDGTTKETVGAFWKAHSFDLGLPNDNGVTPLGNCDMCFLKGKKKRIAIARAHPELVQWWVDAEAEVSKITGGPAWFDKTMSYRELQIIASDGQLDMLPSEDFACFCGD